MIRKASIFLDMVHKFKKIILLLYFFGIFEVINFIFHKIRQKIYTESSIKKSYTFFDSHSRPVYIRRYEPDANSYAQIFIYKEYEKLKDIKDVRFIVDCGGYIGLSSIWFLEHFKDVHIITVEPDVENFCICRKNLKFYGNRCNLIRAAIWSHITGLVIERNIYRDGKAWSAQTREAKADEVPNVLSIDMSSLLADSGFDHVDILKIDIERAEIKLFDSDNIEWISRVRNIAIELHDDECKKIFFNALSAFNYDLVRSGEVTICKNIHLK